jgi:hypothetical protein
MSNEKSKTTNRSVYNKLYRNELSKKFGLCPICGPHSGCNSRFGIKGPYRNWKIYRKTQWK